MLQKYDKVLIIARVMSIVLVVLMALGVLAGGIYGAALIHWAYVFVIPFGLFFDWVLWVFLRLILSFFCDVKMIRNKLYGKNNDYFAEYLQDDEPFRRVQKRTQQSGNWQKNAAANEELRDLQQQLDVGDITREEYEARKEELLKIIRGENE